VVTASTDDTACIWSVRTGQPMMPPLQHGRIVAGAVFSPDGCRVATASIDRTAQIWDARTGQTLTPPLRHDSMVGRVYFTTDGQRLVTTCSSGRARLWDSTTGRPLSEWLNAGTTYWGACFNPAAQRIAVGTTEGIVRIWKIPRASTPVPEWFPRFAEAVAGVRLGERGAMELVPREKLKAFAEQIPAGAATRNYEQIARWFLKVEHSP
jgi:WD40 repeat protein